MISDKNHTGPERMMSGIGGYIGELTELLSVIMEKKNPFMAKRGADRIARTDKERRK